MPAEPNCYTDQLVGSSYLLLYSLSSLIQEIPINLEILAGGAGNHSHPGEIFLNLTALLELSIPLLHETLGSPAVLLYRDKEDFEEHEIHSNCT